VATSLEDLTLRFFSQVGLVEPAGYRTIEVLLGDSVRGYFGGQDYLVLTFATEVVRENPEAQVLSYGSPLLESMAAASLDLGYAAHFYLKGLSLTTGRTLEKVRQQARLPGRILEIGEEGPYLHHHVALRFKVSLVADAHEEAFYNVAVDMHSGWTTMKLEEAMLRLYGAPAPEVFPETRVELSLKAACSRALWEVERNIGPWVQSREQSLRATAREEKEQVLQHYQSVVERLEASKDRKGANLERVADKIRSTRLDQERRLEDVERKYRLGVEVALVQLAVVSYPKVIVPLRLQQGKEQGLGVAVWDPLLHQGYFYPLSPE